MEEKTMISYEGLRELEDELHDRKVNRRREIADAIKVAREQGDLSENAEYDAAKDEQRDNEARIEEIENILKSVEVLDETDIDEKKITIGSKVKIRDLEYKEDMEITIVGPTEANSLEGKISNDSPLGSALMGMERNKKVVVQTPGGPVEYKILSVTRK
ncbi:MAG: transcription elongation factor GreA [Eubacterium sp.]|nr:transcription elongation factor GreA [Eubacterium sp.]